LSAIDTSMCECGRTARKITGWKGRADDTAKVKGQFIYPSQACNVFQKYPQAVSWQLRVKNPEGRDLLVVLVETPNELNEEQFAADFQAIMKLKPIVEVVAPGTIPADAPRLVDERTYE